MKFGLQGIYSLRKYKAATNELIQEIAPFENHITNIGLDRIGVGGSLSYCYVGAGTTPPTDLDTTMQTLLAASAVGVGESSTNSAGVSPYWASITYVYRFGPGEGTGNISEVGVGWGNTSVGTLFSRALVVDELGNPVTITKLADEYLDVSYTLKVYLNTADIGPYTAMVGSTEHTLTSRIANAASVFMGNAKSFGANYNVTLSTALFSGPCVLGPVTGNVTGYTSIQNIPADESWPVASYVPGSYTVKGSRFFSLGEANLPAGGISAIFIRTNPNSNLFGFDTQMVISPPIPKTGTDVMTLNFQYSWGRYTP